MQVLAKIKKSFVLAVVFNLFIFNAYAGNLDQAIDAYKAEEYKKALNLLKSEIEADPNNPEIYKWLAKTYEAMFDIEKSLEAYKTYEHLKRNEQLAVKPTTMPTPIQTFRPTPLPLSTARPTAIPTPRPRPTAIPTPKPTLEPIYKGWLNIDIANYSTKKEIKLIPKNSSDMNEIIEKSGINKEFFLVKCRIKYSKNIIIKSNSDQITLVDQNNNSYPLYAMNTYKFNYGGNQQSQKVEVIQVSDYYELSKKDSRSNIQFLFKINENVKIKNLFVKGYGELVIR